MERLLIRFSKGEAMRFVGHLDLMRVLERAFRRAHFPVAYSQGFNPRPRMSLAAALTLGATSEAELCQLDLARELAPEELDHALAALRAQLPAGLQLLQAWPIPLEKRNPYIQVSAAEYVLTLEGAAGEDPAAALHAYLSATPDAAVARYLAGGEAAPPPAPGAANIVVRLPVGEPGAPRIRELLADLERALPGMRVTRLHRTRLWCELEPPAGPELIDPGKFGKAA